MNRFEYISGIVGVVLSAIVLSWLGSWSTPIVVLWEIFTIVLVITVVFAFTKRITVPTVTPLTDQSSPAKAPEPRDMLETQVQKLGFRYIGDFDVKPMAKTSTRIRAYIDSDSLCAAILIDMTSGNETKTVLEFCTSLQPSGSITTTTKSLPNILSYQLNKIIANVPWKRTAAGVFELHQSLCRTALSEGLTPAMGNSKGFAESLTDDTRKDFEYQVKAHRLRRVAEDQYRLTLLEAIIAAPLLWYQMAYGNLFFWYKLPDGYFCWKLRKRLHRFKQKQAGDKHQIAPLGEVLMEHTIYLTDSMRTEDWEQVRSIYLQGIRTGHSTFEADAPDWDKWDSAHLTEHRLVIRAGNSVLAWAALSPVSSRCAYSGVAEISLYVATGYRGKGIGSTLLKALIDSSEKAGIWTLQGGIFPENKASLRMVKKHGFRKIGRREKIGKMTHGDLAGTWRDVILVERRSKVAGIG